MEGMSKRHRRIRFKPGRNRETGERLAELRKRWRR
jgi:hypothetical protein